MTIDCRRHPLAYEIVFFVALLSTAVTLGGALAHLFELPNKIALARDQYLMVQGIYRGWNRLAFLLAVEFLSMSALVAMGWREVRVFRPAVVALVCLLAAQAVFWAFTYPANVATANWTMLPAEWEALRRSWEYSHALGATLQMAAMAALICAVLGHVRSLRAALDVPAKSGRRNPDRRREAREMPIDHLPLREPRLRAVPRAGEAGGDARPV
jgi:hypothetical protein